MNIELARNNMIEQQIRPWEVLDQSVLDLLQTTPREAFVPPDNQGLAFADSQLPIGHGQFMLEPKMEGRMLQALTTAAIDTVLEIGTGSGYMTALLARSAQRVISLDIESAFTQRAGALLSEHGITNVELITADGIQGYVDKAPYDAIAVTGSVPILDPALTAQLTIGGRMFVIVGQSPVMHATLITRIDEHEWIENRLFETDVPPLSGAPVPEQFRL